MGDYNGTWQEQRGAKIEFRELEITSQTSSADLELSRQKVADLDERFQTVKQRKNIHFMLGLVASLLTVLVNSITVTYFVGTSKWCAEVVDTYSLDMQFTRRSTALKRKTFPWAVGGMLVILTIVSLGAMSDPGVKLEEAANYVAIHYMFALLGIAVIAWSFLVQIGNIGANYEVIEEILDEVRRVRAQRGLDKDDE